MFICLFVCLYFWSPKSQDVLCVSQVNLKGVARVFKGVLKIFNNLEAAGALRVF